MMRATALPDVLTLEETASYLRMPTETIERVATRGQLPGRRIEDSWRFLREAIDEWLRSFLMLHRWRRRRWIKHAERTHAAAQAKT